MKKAIDAALAICLFLVTGSALAVNVIAPSDGNILYTGRWDFSNPTVPWAQAKASSIIVNFQGTGIAVDIDGGNSEYLRAIIDDDASNSFKFQLVDGLNTLASGLTDTTHKLELVKETDNSRLHLLGIHLDDGKFLESPPVRPTRRIEFYGDSNQAGFSLESERNQSGSHLQGAYYTYPGIVARMFNAEHVNFSKSGATTSSLITAHDRIDWSSSSPQWDFGRFQADLVVINIGANDRGPVRRRKSKYHELLDALRVEHPYAHIMLFNAYGWDFNEPANFIHEVIADRGDPDMSFAVFPWVFAQFHGCEYDHGGMAMVLAEHIQSVLGWAPVPQDLMSGFGANGDVANGSFELVAPFGGWGWRYYDDPGVSREHYPATAYDGDYFLRLSNGAHSQQTNPAESGETYTVTAWMRGTNDGDQVDITVDFRDQGMGAGEVSPMVAFTENKTLTTSWQEYKMDATAPTSGNPVYATRVTFTAGPSDTVDIDAVVMKSAEPDSDAPTPDPMEWSALPMAAGGTSITMTAAPATDPSGVEYYFTNVSGNGNDSGWQDSTVYTDTGLQPNSAFSYAVHARDKSSNRNETAMSTIESANTTGGSCTANFIYVDTLTANAKVIGQGNKIGRATATILDDCGIPVFGADVSGTFSGDYEEIRSANTSTDGVAVMDTEDAVKGGVSFTFCVNSVSGGAAPYDEAQNVVTCASK